MSTDVVVIGAGIAGLACGAYLARAGRRVLVLEQAPSAGGCFSSFDQDGFRFDAGIRAIESSGVLFPLLRQLGIHDLELVHDPTALGIEDEVVTLHSDADLGAWFAVLAHRFPAEGRALEVILRDAVAVSARMSGIFAGENPLFLDRSDRQAALKTLRWTLTNLRTFRDMNRLGSLLGMRLADYLAARTSDAGLRRVLALPYPEDAPVHFALGYSRLFQDYYYPRGGMHAVPEALARVIAACGGEVRCASRVERIMVDRGRAAGVTVAPSPSDPGFEVRAPVVVNAGDMRRMVTTPLPAGSAPAGLAERLAGAATTESVFSVYAGVEAPPEEVAPWGAGHVIHAPDRRGADHSLMRSSPEWFSLASIEISLPCLRDPSLAPPGKTGVCLSVAASPRFADGWKSGDRSAYEALKREAADRILASAARLIPALRDRLSFSIAATPVDFERWTLNSAGAITGWRHSREDPVVPQDYLRFPRAVRGPIPGLYQTGHWCFSPGGAPVSFMSAKVASDRILRGRW